MKAETAARAHEAEYDVSPESAAAYHGFRAGVKWMREQCVEICDRKAADEIRKEIKGIK